MENLIADLRYAARTLVKTPAFLLVSVLTLALGIGGNIAIFTLVQAVLLQPLPFPQPERLVRIFDNRAGARDVGMSVPEFEDLRQHSDIFEQISVIFPVPTALTGGERVERIEMLGTSPSYFDMLRAKPALGRAYTQADWVPGFLDPVVISDALWKRQFGGDPNVIGKRIRLDEDGYTIIGVMPPDFRHPGKGLSGDVEVWTAAGFVALPFPVPPVRGGPRFSFWARPSLFRPPFFKSYARRGASMIAPSLPIASTGQPSIASLQSASSSGVSGCL